LYALRPVTRPEAMTKAESFMVMVVSAVEVERGAVRNLKDIGAGRYVWVMGNRRLYILFPSLDCV